MGNQKNKKHHEILSRILNPDLGADCVSGNEVKRVLETGFVANEIVFAEVGKTDTDPKILTYLSRHCPVDHPSHYGGDSNPYETIKVIDAWDLGFSLGNTVKYISRAGKKDPTKEIEDLKKALFYLEHHIKTLEKK